MPPLKGRCMRKKSLTDAYALILTNLRAKTLLNFVQIVTQPNPDLADTEVYLKFCQIPSIHS